MDKQRLPKPGEIYRHFKGNLYQIIAIATHSETGEPLVIYQALYGDFQVYARPLPMFMDEVDREKYPEGIQRERFELIRGQSGEAIIEVHDITDTMEKQPKVISEDLQEIQKIMDDLEPDSINSVLLKFLDADSFSKKLEVLTTNMKHMDDRLINDMAAALDCTIDEGPLEVRVQGLIYCLQAMCRFEDRRLR